MEFLAWLRAALDALLSASTEQVAWAVAAYMVSLLLYAYRLLVLGRLTGLTPRLGFRGAIVAQLVSTLVNNVTPAARAGGELARATLAARMGGGEPGAAVSLVAFERLTEALGVVAVVLGLVLLGGERRPVFYATAAVLVVLVLLAHRLWGKLLGLAERLVPRSYRGRLGLADNATQLHRMTRDLGLMVFGVAVGAGVWALDALRLYFVLGSLNVWVGFEKAVAVSMLYLVAGVAAFTPGGLGIVEGGLMAAFIAAGVPREKAIAATLLERLISYGLSTGLGALTLLGEGGTRLWRALR